MKTLIITAFLIALSTGCDVPADIQIPNPNPPAKGSSPFAGVETHGSVDTAAPQSFIGDAAVIPGPVMVDKLPTTLIGDAAAGPVSYQQQDQTANTILFIEMTQSNVECTAWEQPVDWQDLLLPPVNHVDTEPRCGEL